MNGGRLSLALVFGITLTIWSCAQPPRAEAPLPERGRLLWSADNETGDLSQWTASGGGGAFNTASGTVTVVKVDNAHSGQFVLALEIDNDDGAAHGARIFRWRESPKQGYYSAYLYFASVNPDADWWNVMQFKSVDDHGVSQPAWTVNVSTNGAGEMRLYLWDAIDQVSHPSSAARANVTVPIGRWVNVELYLDESTGPNGRIALLQDGVLLYDLNNEATAISNQVQWSVNNYTDAPTNGVVTILVDDAAIREAVIANDD